ncbi:DUF4381 domain-containing protein [Prevotella melaninogenica]|uniref:DUF4381 domain-containing protein n=1 Tax=Prevotella melaninogenica TaxID=28132 RepID=UPI001BA99EC2|nr:DUF4381 domain-containing protein [Prevotella melaninogenica]QUB60186.1 DUF4381 domain-containing protein [Prevotella melaninogenica]
MRKYIVIFILLILAVVSHAQVQVTASVDSTKILIGGRSHYFITVYAPKGTKISFPEFNNKKEIISDVEVLSAKSDTANANGKVRIRRIYTITAWDAKRYTIPAQKVIVDGATKTTGNVALDVQAVPIDTVKSTPMPPDDIQKVPFSWGEWVPVILVLVLALILICIVFYLYRILCHKKNGRTPKNTRTLSYYEQAKQDLSEIAANKMLYAEQKDYYTDVTNVLRKYISQRYNINALEMTSHEILGSMKDVCDVSELKVVFNTADLVKFAKYSTDANDMTYYFDSIVHFIDSTKVDEPKEVIEEPKENISDTRSRKTIKFAIGLLLVTSVALLIYAAFEAYALLM